MQPTSSNLLQRYMSQHYKWNLFAALQFNKIQFHNFLPRHPREIIFLSRWIRFILAASRLLAALHHLPYTATHSVGLQCGIHVSGRELLSMQKKKERQKRCKSEEWYGEITKKSVATATTTVPGAGRRFSGGSQSKSIRLRSERRQKTFFGRKIECESLSELRDNHRSHHTIVEICQEINELIFFLFSSVPVRSVGSAILKEREKERVEMMRKRGK